MLAFNEDLENPDIRQEPMSLWYWIKHCFCRLMRFLLFCLDVVISRFIWIQIFLYRKIAKKEPLYLTGKELAVNKTIRRQEESLARLQRKFEDLMIDYQNKQSEIEHLQYNLREAVQETIHLQRENDDLTQRFQRNIDDLKPTIAAVSREKDDALRRLSEVVSVKVRDNIPDIEDLNDACRPTKLAEMFSELYDNEWTSAFALLDEHFTEVQAVVILLDTVMEAYYYCEKKLEEPWQMLSEWFLTPNLPGLQQADKWLKHSRKFMVLDKVGEVDEELEELLFSICKVQEVEEMLQQSPVQNYIRKCIELCLLMVSTDPPVVISCPGWIPSKPMTKEEKEKAKEGEKGSEEFMESSYAKSSGKKEDERLIERQQFDKDMFKEYTTRGKYLEFVVWPAMYLHKGGPLFGKGVAQGTKERTRKAEQQPWSWRNLYT